MDILQLYRHLKMRTKTDVLYNKFDEGIYSGFDSVLRWIRREALQEYVRRRAYRKRLEERWRY